MEDNKARDDQFFNCEQEHEINYVAGRYEDRDRVKAFLIEKCKSKEIHYKPHIFIYELIEKELGYPIPLKKK